MVSHEAFQGIINLSSLIRSSYVAGWCLAVSNTPLMASLILALGMTLSEA